MEIKGFSNKTAILLNIFASKVCNEFFIIFLNFKYSIFIFLAVLSICLTYENFNVQLNTKSMQHFKKSIAKLEFYKKNYNFEAHFCKTFAMDKINIFPSSYQDLACKFGLNSFYWHICHISIYILVMLFQYQNQFGYSYLFSLFQMFLKIFSFYFKAQLTNTFRCILSGNRKSIFFVPSDISISKQNDKYWSA